MADVHNVWKVDLAARVQDLTPAVQVGKVPTVQVGKVPTPVSGRLDELCDALDAAGESKPTRQFLVAALIGTTDLDPEALAARLKEYRLARVHEIIPSVTETEGIHEVPRPRE